MFRRHRQVDLADAVAPPRVRTVRLLKTEEELRTAVERARAFEQKTAEQGGVRGLNYERYFRDRPERLADVVHIDSGSSNGS